MDSRCELVAIGREAPREVAHVEIKTRLTLEARLYTAFHQKFTDIGVTETRTIVEINDGRRGDTFLFLELYCDEVGCDCRRVFVQVDSVKNLEARRPATLATLVYGWEGEQFYRDWAGHPLDPADLLDLKGPGFPRLQPQSARSEEMLAHFNDLLKDPTYVERIKRHYAKFRADLESAAPKPAAGGNRDQRRAAKRRAK